MLIILDGTNQIAVTKGDSAYFTITITGDVPEDGMQALFTVKDAGGRTMISKVFPVIESVVSIELYSRDTNKLEPGKYKWDVRFPQAPNDCATPMVPGTFIVLEAVGDV